MQSNSKKIISGNQADIFSYIVNSIHRITSLPVSIWVPRDDGKALVIAAAIGLPESYIQSAFLDLRKPSVTVDAFLSKKIRRVMDIASDTRWKYKEQAREMNWKSAICVPIKAENVVIGVISVYAYTQRSISEMANILPDFAKQIAQTLEAAKQKEVLEKILDINAKLQSMTDNPRQILNSIVKAACDLTGANCAVAYPFDTEHGEFYDLENVAYFGIRKDLELSKKLRSSGGMASYVRRKGEVVLADIGKQDPEMAKTSSFIKREKIKAFMAITLRVADDMLGILYVNFRSPHIFSKNEKSTIRLFSHQASIALYNARIYQQAASQIRALEKLHEAGTSLTSIPTAPGDLRNTLLQIAQSAKEVLHADLIELYQYIQSEDWYDLPPIQVGEHYRKFVIKDTIHPDDVIWEIVRGRQPIYTIDAQNSKVLTKPFAVKRPNSPKKRYVIRERINSSAAIPLLAGDEVLGVLFANYRTPQIFSREQKRLLELFASQAAIAIRNARLFQELYGYMQSLNGQMQSLHNVAQRQNIRDVLEQILIGINTLFNEKTSASINLYNERKNIFEAYQAAGPLKRFLMKVPPRPLGSGGTGRFVIETGYSLYLDNVQRPPENTPTIRQESIDKGICSFAALPLKRDAHVLGVLFVNSQKPIIFTEGIKGILELFASQAAIAIENNRLYEQRDRNINDKQAINDLTQKLAENIGVGEEGILKILHKSAGELMDTNNMYVALYDEQTDIVRFGLAFVDGHKVNVEKDEKWQPRKAGKGRTEEIIQNKHPILISTMQEAEEWYAEPGREEYIGSLSSSWLGVPMIIGDKVLGVIATYHPSYEHIYSGDDLEILQAMANQVAVALNNTRLYYRTNQRLNALVDFEQAITTAIRQGENEILQLIHTQASKLMDTNNMYVALYDEQTDIVRFGLAFVDGHKVNVEKDEKWQPRKAGKGRTEEIIRFKKPILSSTLQEAEEWYAEPGREEYIGKPMSSWLGVPMIIGDKVLGVIATYNPTQGYSYSGDDLEILQAMANQATVALDSARSFEKAQKRILDQETINNIAQAISMKVGTSELLQTIVAQIQENLECTHCAIFLPEKIRNEVVLTSKYTHGEFAHRIKSRRFKPGEGLAGWVFEHGVTLIVPDTLQDNRYVPIREGGYLSRSLMAVPVKMNERVVGVISIDHNGINAFDEDDCRLVETVAEHVSIALEKGRAYEEVAKLYKEARGEVVAAKQLATLGTAIAALQHRINNTLNIIIPNIKRLRRRIDVTDPTIKEVLDIIERNTRYTSDILMRIQAPLQEVESNIVNLNSLLSDIAGIAKKEWSKKSHLPKTQIILDLDDSIPLIYLPVGQISEIVRNLIDNSCRAMKKGGKLLIVSKIEENIIYVRIKDTAEGGIPPAIQERLFQKPVPSKEPGHGAGLGLWLSKLMLQGVGGDVTIEKTGPAGTTMLIQIPVSDSRKEAAI